MEVILKIDELKPSASNVRAKHTKEDIKMMADSITHRGIINPIAVAKNGDGRYEILAGRLRYEGAKAAGVEKVRCFDMTALTEPERVEISLSENVDRRGMTAMQYHAAFNKLFKAGMAVPKIGERFNKTEREVQQILAIGSLPKKILDLYDEEEIGDRTLRALAIASGKDVVRYGKLTAKERPRDWDIQVWLDGDGGRYLAKHAMFDLDAYHGPQVTDLFGKEDEIWLTDGNEFMRLQNLCIKADIAAHEGLGWKVEEVDHWQSWGYDKVSKAKGGQIFWCRNRDGSVEFHKGYKRQPKAGKAPAPTSNNGEAPAKPATSKAFDDYCTELRHNAVCAAMLADKKHGLVAAVILLLKQCDNISLRYTGGKVKADGYISSINEQDDNLDIQDARLNMYTELNISDGMTWDLKIPELAEKLLEQPPATLQRYIITLLAVGWEVDGDGKDGDEIGKALGINGVDRITLDDGFWNGLTNKATLLAIAKEHKIAIDEKATLKVIRALLKDKVPENWLPDWLTF